jgi:hypothetical protein
LVKYRIARVAFAQGQPPAAYSILRSVEPEVENAIELGAAVTGLNLAYMREGAWGFFHMERADRHAANADYEAAFLDYAEAARLFQPVLDNTSREEKLTATIKAGLMAARLGDTAAMLDYYDEGMALAQTYRSQINVKTHLNTAQQELAALTGAPGLDPALVRLIDAVVERLATAAQ